MTARKKLKVVKGKVVSPTPRKREEKGDPFADWNSVHDQENDEDDER